MRKVVGALSKIEHHLRWAAVVVTTVVLAGAIFIPPLWRTTMSIADDLPQPAIAIGRGYELVVGEKTVRAYGDDVCPDKVTGCINLSGRTAVTVHLSDGTTELWSIRQEGRRTFLVRPNGELVRSTR